MVLSFYHPASKRITVIGINSKTNPVSFNASLKNLPEIHKLEMYYTDQVKNVFKQTVVEVANGSCKTTIPPNCIFTFTGFAE